MTDTPAPAWRPTGLVWTEAGAALEWLSPAGDVRASAVDIGARLSLMVGLDRRCVGLRWDGRRVPCTARAPIDTGAKSGQCDSCAAIARTRSVATDTVLDDPREFCVYLAHHGSVVKVGITATERGYVRQAGVTINGEGVCRIGRDLYLSTPAGIVLLDTGLLQGWGLNRAEGDAPLTARMTPVTKPRAATEVQHDVLF